MVVSSPPRNFRPDKFAGAGRIGSLFDSNAMAIMAAFTTPATMARQQLINTFVVALKESGVWAALDVLYVLAAADSQAALINWRNPGTFNATAVNSPTHKVDRGFTGDGASSRIDTTWTPNTNGIKFLQNDASAWYWGFSSGTMSTGPIGNASVAPRVAIAPRSVADAFNGRINDNTGLAITSITDAAGFWGMQRTASNARTAFRNGVSIGSDTTASTGRPTQSQWILGGNATSFSTASVSAAAWGASLAGLEARFYAAVLAYMQGVGVV